MAVEYAFADEEMVIDEGLGYPRAYAKICRDRSLGPYPHGPPFTFIPYVLHQNENLRAKELDELFPLIDPKARPSAKPKIFINLLWKQLSHLGNAGFDPEVIRVDPYGNVLYYHADSASPLSWDIDHWFPCSRGGLTVASNLRILQWQVCKKKYSKLEFQVPWWDFQLGISVNQFLSIFASRNSDFRHRAFSFLFAEGENEEINASQTVDSHSFPQHFIKSKDEFGLAPAAVVVTRKELYDSSSALKSLVYNRQIRPESPIIAARKMKGSILKENENPDFVTNPYQAIVMARDSLKQREETNKMQAEIQKLDAEVSEMRKKNDEEKFAIQDLEAELIKRRRRAEKSVVYKEQVRLNQAAANALTARLEAQKAICDASEKELHKKFKQRDELEKQIRPELEHARKRSRTDTFFQGQDSKTVLYLPGIRPMTPSHKELRVFLEEEHKASVAGLSSNEDQKHEEIEEELAITARNALKHKREEHKASVAGLSSNEDQKHEEIEEELAITARNALKHKREEHDKAIAALEDERPIEQKFERLEIKEERQGIRYPVIKGEEDEESRRQRGKGNVDRWLQMLLENSQEELEPQNDNVVAEEVSGTDDIIKKLDLKYPLKEKKEDNNVNVEGNKTPRRNSNASEVIGSRKERVLKRSESARAFRRIPSSPSLILGGMKKGVECIRKKPIVASDDEQDYYAVGNNFIKSSFKTIKKAVKI
ncbi:hypothetical protein Godav_018869 [Gossypium davidsonii]|uniref:Uncharacterized protein n=1 Tax=Gossypium davidsonii TaxID=34287 RepID=A0A7J8QXV1_GOSDV|nr:hypothetical protein [Gossypium davidsonii]